TSGPAEVAELATRNPTVGTPAMAAAAKLTEEAGDGAEHRTLLDATGHQNVEPDECKHNHSSFWSSFES
ncbi:MAG: hypothetical protein Q8O54_09855, partial [Brevundimonas sp.]|nr:hypothetical protein [Brevundimonas sp.]